MDVVGVDGAKGGWAAIRLANGRFAEARFFKAFGELAQAFRKAVVITVDIPIGLPARGRRPADVEARKVLGPRARSVFPTPPPAVLRERDFDKAVRLAKRLDSPVTRQGHSLGPRILEVESAAIEDERIFEVHPEVSFWAMNGGPLRFSKATWNGLMLRLALLRQQGISLPTQITGMDDVPTTDVVDAAAAAWSAWRISRGEAQSLPDPPPKNGGAIWY